MHRSIAAHPALAAPYGRTPRPFRIAPVPVTPSSGGDPVTRYSAEVRIGGGWVHLTDQLGAMTVASAMARIETFLAGVARSYPDPVTYCQDPACQWYGTLHTTHPLSADYHPDAPEGQIEPKTGLRPYQQEALDAVAEGFRVFTLPETPKGWGKGEPTQFGHEEHRRGSSYPGHDEHLKREEDARSSVRREAGLPFNERRGLRTPPLSTNYIRDRNNGND